MGKARLRPVSVRASKLISDETLQGERYIQFEAPYGNDILASHPAGTPTRVRLRNGGGVFEGSAADSWTMMDRYKNGKPRFYNVVVIRQD